MTNYTMETTRRVYCDDDGSFIEIAPDKDGLRLVEISDVGATLPPVLVPPEMALLLADAIRATALEMIGENTKGARV